MRTTLNLDEDMLLAVKERARRERRSTEAVLSDLARQALIAGSGEAVGDGATASGPFRGAALPSPTR